MAVLERIDGSISAASGLGPSVLSVHQDLYGPDEMAHTDGSASASTWPSIRIRALLSAVLTHEDPTAFGALVDLVLHEKAHVSLASYVPRANAEHGASFYGARTSSAAGCSRPSPPATCPIPSAGSPRCARGLASTELPSIDALAAAFSQEPLAA